MHKVFRTISITILLMTSITLSQSAIAGLKPYSASYYVTYDRFSANNKAVLLFDEETGQYTYTSETKPRGLAAIMGKLRENSQFTIAEDTLKPQIFTHKGRDALKVTYDWSNNTALSIVDKKEKEIPLTGAEIDLGHIQMQLMYDLNTGSLKSKYSVIKEHEIKNYTVDVLGEEELTIGKRQYNTVKLKQAREGSSRHSILWLDKDNQHVVVKIEQYKLDKLKGTLTLTSYKETEVK